MWVLGQQDHSQGVSSGYRGGVSHPLSVTFFRNRAAGWWGGGAATAGGLLHSVSREEASGAEHMSKGCAGRGTVPGQGEP